MKSHERILGSDEANMYYMVIELSKSNAITKSLSKFCLYHKIMDALSGIPSQLMYSSLCLSCPF